MTRPNPTLPPAPRMPKVGKRKATRAPSFVRASFDFTFTPGVPHSRVVRVSLPIRLVSEQNQHEHWRAKASRVRDQRETVERWLRAHTATMTAPLDVTIVRVAPRLMDSDNAVGSAKAVRDSVAAWLGLKDGPSDPVTWSVEQEKSAAYGVRIVIREVEVTKADRIAELERALGEARRV